MFCRYCGTEIKDESKFCPNCGKALNETTQQIPTQQAQPQTINIVQNAPQKRKKHYSLLIDIIMLILIFPIWLIWIIIRPKYEY